MKLLPIRRVLCTPCDHAPCHFMQIKPHTSRAYVLTCNLPPALLAETPVDVCFLLAMSNLTVELLVDSRRMCCGARQLVKFVTGIITKRLNTEHDTYTIQTLPTCLEQSQNDSTQDTKRIIYRHHQPVLGLVVCVERTDFGQQNPHYV